MNFLFKKKQQIYMAPLRASLASEKPMLTQQEFDTLFPRLDIIIGLNTELLGSIYERVTNWTDHTCLADIFLHMAAFFKMYTEYCSKYEGAAAIYRHLVKKKPAFYDFLSKVENLQDIHGLDLPSFLILPCQRIPRYLMLITELNKWTWSDHPDKANLEKAVEKWQEVANHVNDSMDEAARMNELLQIEGKFKNTLNLVVPYRKFIKQGPIHKVTSRIVVTPTYFLFNDIMVYGYPNNDESEVRYKGTIQLNTAWVRNLADTDELKNGFQLVTPEKAYTLYLSSAKEKRDWIEAIDSCINRLVAIDPMLVTKRATQVKKTARVGQKLWNLFTKDTEAYSTSEDALIKEQVSSMNQSLAETIGKKKLVPIRTSLEFNWTEMRDKSIPQPDEAPKSHPLASTSTPPRPKVQPQSLPPVQPSHVMQPDVVHDNQRVPVKHGISREEDPNGESPVMLDEVIPSSSPSVGRKGAQSSPTTRTNTKLIAEDKHYHPLLTQQQQRSRYGTHDNRSHTNNDCCSCQCSIM